jgi:hypothetical protein
LGRAGHFSATHAGGLARVRRVRGLPTWSGAIYVGERARARHDYPRSTNAQASRLSLVAGVRSPFPALRSRFVTNPILDREAVGLERHNLSGAPALSPNVTQSILSFVGGRRCWSPRSSCVGKRAAQSPSTLLTIMMATRPWRPPASRGMRRVARRSRSGRNRRSDRAASQTVRSPSQRFQSE